MHATVNVGRRESLTWFQRHGKVACYRHSMTPQTGMNHPFCKRWYVIFINSMWKSGTHVLKLNVTFVQVRALRILWKMTGIGMSGANTFSMHGSLLQ